MTYPLGGSGSTVDTELVDVVTIVEADTRTTWAGFGWTHSRTVTTELVDVVQFLTADTRLWSALRGERNPTFPQLDKQWTTWPSAL